MQNLKSLSTKDKMLLSKAVADIAMDIYKSQNSFIFNQIVKQGKYESNYGKFWIETKEAKTVAEVLAKKQEEVEKLQKEIEALKLLDKDMQFVDTKATLYSKHTKEANDIAKELLQDLIANLDSKRLNKASKR